MNNPPEPVDILLVEDNPTDAEFVQRELKKNNLTDRLVWVKNGEEALDFVFAIGAYKGRDMTSGPKLILLDLRLPKVDGIDVLRRIKSYEPTQNIPVVILSSSQGDLEIAECYRLGVKTYINKPVEAEAFVALLSQVGIHPPVDKSSAA